MPLRRFTPWLGSAHILSVVMLCLHLVSMYSQVNTERLTRQETPGQLLFLAILVQSMYFARLVSSIVVSLQRARLVLEWVTVWGFESGSRRLGI